MKFIYPFILALFLVGCWDDKKSDGNEANAEEQTQVQQEESANGTTGNDHDHGMEPETTSEE